MGVEAQIEGVLRDEITTAVAGLLTTDPKIFTFLAEAAYSAGDEDLSGNNVMIMASPSSRETGHTTQRVVPVHIECSTYVADDKDRRQLKLLYEKVRLTIENTAFDFGADITYTEDSYEITSPGSAGVEENYNMVDFDVDFHVCAEAFE